MGLPIMWLIKLDQIHDDDRFTWHIIIYIVWTLNNLIFRIWSSMIESKAC